MKIGACRRALTTRSSNPLPRIGSVLAVQVTMMSNSGSRSGISFSVIASALEALGELPAALDRPVGDRHRLRASWPRSASRSSSIISPAPMNSSRCSAIDGKMRSASFTEAAAIEIDALPMSVCVRTSFATANVRWKRRFSTRPERARRLRVAHRLLHLAQDLRLAQHHRIEPARHAKRVRHGLVTRQRVEVRRQRILRHAVEILEPLDHRLRLGAVDVDLGPVAGRQDRRFLHLRPRPGGRAARARARPARTRPAPARRAVRSHG